MNSCKGKFKDKITRQRITKKEKEVILINLVFAFDKIEENNITELVMDEEKQHSLMSYRKTK